MVLQTIRDLGLELQVIFNKGAVMILPSGINKATGLAAALKCMHISPDNVVAIGDAENDHALLESCGIGVAVANAIPLLKAHADWVTDGPSGEGVQQLVARLLADDLARIASANPQRYRFAYGIGHVTKIVAAAVSAARPQRTADAHIHLNDRGRCNR